MPIETNKVVAFHYQLSQVGGEPLESTPQDQPTLYLHGHNNILPAMEAEFTGKEAGDTFVVELSPEQAYGQPEENRRGRVPIKRLLNPPKRLQAGMRVQISTEKGPLDARVIKVGKFNVDVDANHPLAGMSLRFDIEIVSIRDPSPEELKHNHAHGVGGHQH